jgi:uncharacterized protein YciI
MTARSGAPLCVISLHYQAPLDEIDTRMSEHVAWLARGYDEGLFLASGRKVPRTGGIILCRGHKAEVEALTASDPFVSSGTATADVTEFRASLVHDTLAELLA